MKASLVVCALATFSVPSRAAESGAFLKLGVGARALGLGGAYTAVADDASSLAWNPAGLAAAPKRELSASHAALSAGLSHDWLGFSAPGRVAWAVSASRLSQDSLDGRDAAGRPTGSFTASDSVVSLGLGARAAGGLRLGGAVKAIETRIAEASARTFAVDAGVQAPLAAAGPGTPVLGFAVLNAGPGLRLADRRDPLPLTLAAGLAYRLPPGLTLSFDARHRPGVAKTEYALGSEYAVFSSFSIRAGYASAAASVRGTRTSALDGFAAGLGVRGRGYTLDYAMTPFGEFGSVQRFTLGARF